MMDDYYKVNESPLIKQMTVFKSMFVSLNLPYSVVRGEEFALVATVFNYLEDDLEAKN